MSSRTIGDKLVPILAALLVIFLVSAAISQYLTTRTESRVAGQAQYYSEQAVVSQIIARQGALAIRGDDGAFDKLADLKTRVSSIAAVPPGGIPTGLESEVGATRSAREEIVQHLDGLATGRDALRAARDASTGVQQLMPQLLAQVGNLVGSLGPTARASVAPHIERFEVAGQRVQQDMLALASGMGALTQASQRLSGGDDYLGQVVRGLAGEDAGLGIEPLQGAEVAGQLAQVQSLFGQISDQVRTAIGAADKLIFVQTANRQLGAASERWFTSADALAARANASRVTGFAAHLPLLFVAGALLAFLGFVTIHRGTADARRIAEHAATQNERNQDAILRLLDELGSLADGDLTVQATVTEDITGAIADSINYAVEALRGLVFTIEDTAIQVDAAARQTQATAGHMAKASENQSKQVGSATESIANMAGSIEEVSGNAERSADVARHSVDIAHKGGDAVRRTIEGMNTIRETIQDTSKRIKRLGESSQEIGNIVELINDIAEQTNILALNASIQASMAGEQGRGFAVVADEVQRLAERSANATKQIEVLVKTIQSDTKEAVESMERSTADVVSGALLAENAGSSLDEIEKVSNQIATLVQNISSTARQQATAAAGMTRNMGVLQEISAQSADSTSATSEAIGQLAALAGELRKSVAGFTLPDPAKTPSQQPQRVAGTVAQPDATGTSEAPTLQPAGAEAG